MQVTPIEHNKRRCIFGLYDGRALTEVVRKCCYLPESVLSCVFAGDLLVRTLSSILLETELLCLIQRLKCQNPPRLRRHNHVCLLEEHSKELEILGLEMVLQALSKLFLNNWWGLRQEETGENTVLCSSLHDEQVLVFKKKKKRI